MYICDICTTVFDGPIIRMERNTDGDHAWTEKEQLCPICGTADHFEPANRCQCGEYKRATEYLCAACRKAMRQRFAVFAAELTADETKEFDEWAESGEISEWRNWM